jgi:hypothetical protein
MHVVHRYSTSLEQQVIENDKAATPSAVTNILCLIAISPGPGTGIVSAAKNRGAGAVFVWVP